MQVPATERRNVRFGSFEVDLTSCELRKDGHKIKLQEKPFQILVILLDQPGELVTREEFRQKLWPADTFVDFEHSINTAVKKLREALEDHAQQPRFIETVPKHGYRFIGQFNETLEEETASEASEKASAAPSKETVAAATRQTRTRYRRYALLGLVVIAAVALPVGLNVGGIRNRWLREKLSEQDTIVLAEFSNSTSDPVFDDTLKQALRIALDQSPFLNVLPEEKVAATLRRMVRPSGTALTGEVVRELCQRTGSKAYVEGSIAKLDNEYVLGLKAVNCQAGSVLVKEIATAPSKEEVLNALGNLTARMRGQLGESLATVQKFDVPLAEATTSSLEALKALSLCVKAEVEKGPGAALPFALRAIQLDPNFTSAYSYAGAEYAALGEPDRASQYFTKAFELRTRRDEPGTQSAADYYSTVTGELDKAARVYQALIEDYPRRPNGYANLGVVYTLQGRYEKAAEAYKHSRNLAPDNPGLYFNLAISLIALQRFDESRQVIQEAQARRLDIYLLHVALYDLAFIGSDSAAMAKQEELLLGKPESKNLGLALASDTEAFNGHLEKARALTRQSVDSAIEVDSKESGALYRAQAGLREIAYGNEREARKSAAMALHLAPTSQGGGVEAALAFAMAGDTARAESLAQDLNKRFPLDTQIQTLWLPTIRAQLALDRKNPAAAIDLLQPAVPIELGQTLSTNSTSCLYLTYIRGQAFLASGQGNAAGSEFQKIIGHSGIVCNCWTGALAHLGLARANAMQATTLQGAQADAARARALAAYRDFLTLWKDADPDVPILKEAKAEYAKLQ